MGEKSLRRRSGRNDGNEIAKPGSSELGPTSPLHEMMERRKRGRAGSRPESLKKKKKQGSLEDLPLCRFPRDLLLPSSYLSQPFPAIVVFTETWTDGFEIHQKEEKKKREEKGGELERGCLGTKKWISCT